MQPCDPDQLRVAVVEEQVSVERRQVQTDRVRVRTLIDLQETMVEEQLQVGRLDVMRHAVERQVSEAPVPYRVGDTLIIPVVEERLVVEKRLFVVEEVHVTTTSHAEAISIPVTLRQTRAVIERNDPDPSTTGNQE